MNDNNKLSLTFIASPTQSGGPGKFGVDPSPAARRSRGRARVSTTVRSPRSRASSPLPPTTRTSSGGRSSTTSGSSSTRWWAGTTRRARFFPPTGAPQARRGLLAAVPNVNWNLQGTNTYGNPVYHGLQDFEPGFNTVCQSPNPAKVSTLCPVTTYNSGGPNGRIDQQTLQRWVGGSTLTYLVEAAGHHVIKVGVSAEYTTYGRFKGHAGGTSINESTSGVLSDGEHFGVLLGPDNPSFLEPYHVTTKSVIAGGFVQDSWSVLDKFTSTPASDTTFRRIYAGDGDLGMIHPERVVAARSASSTTRPSRATRSSSSTTPATSRTFRSALADGAFTGEPSVLATSTKRRELHRGRRQPAAGCQSNEYRAIEQPGGGAVAEVGSVRLGTETVDPSIAHSPPTKSCSAVSTKSSRTPLGGHLHEARGSIAGSRT